MIKRLDVYSKVRILDIPGRVYGNMTTDAKFFEEETTSEERQTIFLKRRLYLGEQQCFDGYKVFMADQKDKTGTYKVLTSDFIEAKKDGWTNDISEDIIIVTDKTLGVVAGHPVADCPVVIMESPTHGMTAVCHCSAELVDKHLPELTTQALIKASGCREEEIIAHITSCAGDDWTYDYIPKWATDREVWKNSIFEYSKVFNEEDPIYKINIRRAIFDQLEQFKLNCIRYNDIDTISNPRYYSNSAAMNNQKKSGRNFAGAFYEGDYAAYTKKR